MTMDGLGSFTQVGYVLLAAYWAGFVMSSAYCP
jgi:hypothetical protein